MPVIDFEGTTFQCDPDEVLLEALLRQNARIPWSCRAGLCHSCMVQVNDGPVNPSAQTGLNPEQINQQLILACQCRVTSDMAVVIPRRSNKPIEAMVSGYTLLTPTLLELTLSPQQPCDIAPGQYIELAQQKDSDSRRFSTVSRFWKETDIRIHVARRAGGDFSSWLFDHATPGTRLWIHGTGGDCVVPDDTNKPVVIFGAGAGIGAALSVAEQAVHNEHRNVHLLLLDIHNIPDYELPESMITVLDSKQSLKTYIENTFSQKTGTPLTQCHWLLYGRHKRIRFLEQLLLDAKVSPENIRSSAYIHREP